MTRSSAVLSEKKSNNQSKKEFKFILIILYMLEYAHIELVMTLVKSLQTGEKIACNLPFGLLL